MFDDLLKLICFSNFKRRNFEENFFEFDFFFLNFNIILPYKIDIKTMQLKINWIHIFTKCNKNEIFCVFFRIIGKLNHHKIVITFRYTRNFNDCAIFIPNAVAFLFKQMVFDLYPVIKIFATINNDITLKSNSVGYYFIAKNTQSSK